MSLQKGAKCSINGKKYELEVHNIVKKCKLNNNVFNKQKEDELGGCGSKNDIVCIMDSIAIPIEIKKIKTPDWVQRLVVDFILKNNIIYYFLFLILI